MTRPPELLPKNPTFRFYPKDYGIQASVHHSNTGVGGLADVVAFTGPIESIEQCLSDALVALRGRE